MLTYNVGITEINTQVRRLGYASAILCLLGTKSLNETLLYDRLGRWSEEHVDELKHYTNPQGQIKHTRRNTGAKRYTDFVVALGLVGRIAGACRVTRFGKTILPFVQHNQTNNPFQLNNAEKYAYLYWLFVKDGDRLLTVFDMLAESAEQPLSLLQKKFQDSYLKRLEVRQETEESKVAREILAVRNRVTYEWKNPQRYAENIVPPRINWLLDVGLVTIAKHRGKPVTLTAGGKQIHELLPKFPGTSLSTLSFSWIRNAFFKCVGPALSNQVGDYWKDIPFPDKIAHIRNMMSQAFAMLRTTPTPKISLYPALLYIALTLAAEFCIWVDIEDILQSLLAYSQEPDTIYEVRFSNRENESYVIHKPA